MTKKKPVASIPYITHPDRDVTRIGIVSFAGNMKPALDILRRWADEHPSIHLYINGYLKPFAGGRIKVKPDTFLRSNVDLLLSLGGDGTFLAAARMVRGRTRLYWV